MSSTTSTAVISVRDTPGAIRRYRRAYCIARSTAGFGNALKYVGFFSAAAIYTGGLVAYQLIPSERYDVPVVTILLFVCAVLAGLGFYSLGVRACAQGQLLETVLDSAVYASPFLSNVQRAQVMSLKRPDGETVEMARAA